MNLVKTIKIEDGMPTVDTAIRRLTYEISASKKQGIIVLKIIHGYGSSGIGGRLRVEIRKYLERQKRFGKIKMFVPGEKFSIFEKETIALLDNCGELRKDNDLNRSNNGITFLLL